MTRVLTSKRSIVVLAILVGVLAACAWPDSSRFGYSSPVIGVAAALGVAAACLAVMLVVSLSAPFGRERFIADVSRIWRWEFWPTWFFYLPLVPWFLWLGARHRGFILVTAVNPGIPNGGFVKDSKTGILGSMPSPCVLAFTTIQPGDLGQRVSELCDAMSRRGWQFPIILKPDSGLRGGGVRLVRSIEQAERYFVDHPAATIAQVYHPGPYEAGLFFYRYPGEKTGRIFSITDKHFPYIEGDGVSTLRQLIWSHPRYRMQADRFLARHASDADRVLAKGQSLRLSQAGNHCQGTLFRDGSHLITPRLEAAINEVVCTFEGFHFGRFDLRYRDPESFKRGEEFGVVELNGVTSESTNIYDPDKSLLWAYRTLARQWAIAFEIGAINRRRGVQPTTWRKLIAEIYEHVAGPPRDLVSD